MNLSSVHECHDTSDVTPLYPPTGLYLKPMSRINITIHFPTLKQSIPTGGTNVSSWGIMEKLKALVSPDQFITIKTVKNTLEFIRFEGDLENRSVLKGVIGRLDGKKMKVTGIKEPLKILAAETKIQFPTKYDWDSFFRDARHMNEMKPGERPDTIHFQNLPIEWFAIPKSKDKDATGSNEKDSSKPDPRAVPSERIFRRVWEGFGDIRCVDIPMLDPYRTKIKSSLAGIKTFAFHLDRVFEGYVQYKEYLGFVKAMDALRCCFLARKDDDKLFVASIKVDFDKSRHMSEEIIIQRKLEVEKLRSKEANSTTEKKGDGKTNTKGSAKGKEAETATGKDETKTSEQEGIDIDRKIAMEERKYLVARRKLEAIRLIDFLFERLKAKKIVAEEEEKKRRKKKRELKRAAAAAATKMENASGTVVKMSKTDRMRERIIAARKTGPEETRRKEMVAKSVKRALQGTRTIHLNRGHYATSRFRGLLSTRDGHVYAEVPSVVPIYGDPSADLAYERYFKSISRR